MRAHRGRLWAKSCRSAASNAHHAGPTFDCRQASNSTTSQSRSKSARRKLRSVLLPAPHGPSTWIKKEVRGSSLCRRRIRVASARANGRRRSRSSSAGESETRSTCSRSADRSSPSNSRWFRSPVAHGDPGGQRLAKVRCSVSANPGVSANRYPSLTSPSLVKGPAAAVRLGTSLMRTACSSS
jgi:hypothetical protein